MGLYIGNNSVTLIVGNQVNKLHIGIEEDVQEPTIPPVEEIYYSITNNLTNCVNSNAVMSVIKGGKYLATIIPNTNHTLKTISVTMDGQPISVTNGNINITNVTGNIVITAVAEEKEEITIIEPNIINTDNLIAENAYKNTNLNTITIVNAETIGNNPFSNCIYNFV